jgi:LacI family transcriptional regulator
MAVTLAKIAVEVGVDVSLVSRVLRGRPDARISDEKRAQILDIAKALGYRPNRIAQSLRTRRTNILAMLTPDITNPFHSLLFRAVERAAALIGYHVILCNTDDSSERFRQVVETLAEGHVEGLLIATAQPEDAAIDWLRERDLPFVLLNRRRNTEDDPWIGPDDYQIGSLGAHHLAKLGHTRIALLGGPPTSNMMLREAGFRAALKSRKCPVDEPLIVMGIESREAAKQNVRRLLRLPRDRRPTAFFVPHTLLTPGAFMGIYESGLRIPRDISLIGYSASPTTDITSACVPLDEIGRQGAEYLIRRLRGDDILLNPNLQIVLPVTLVDAGTTSTPPDIKTRSSKPKARTRRR